METLQTRPESIQGTLDRGDSHRLRQTDPGECRRILHLQKEQGLRFGDAAVKLGLLSNEHIQYASQRGSLTILILMKGDGAISDELMPPISLSARRLRLYGVAQPVDAALDIKIPVTNMHKALVVASPGHREGRAIWPPIWQWFFPSWASISTLLVDSDMRTPRQHKLFNLVMHRDYLPFCPTAARVYCIQRIHSFIDLSVLPAGPVPPNPQELLGRPSSPKLFEDITREL